MLLRIGATVGFRPSLPTAVNNRRRSPARRVPKVMWARFPADNKEDETRQRIIREANRETGLEPTRSAPLSHLFSSRISRPSWNTDTVPDDEDTTNAIAPVPMVTASAAT